MNGRLCILLVCMILIQCIDFPFDAKIELSINNTYLSSNFYNRKQLVSMIVGSNDYLLHINPINSNTTGVVLTRLDNYSFSFLKVCEIIPKDYDILFIQPGISSSLKRFIVATRTKNSNFGGIDLRLYSFDCKQISVYHVEIDAVVYKYGKLLLNDVGINSNKLFGYFSEDSTVSTQSFRIIKASLANEFNSVVISTMNYKQMFDIKLANDGSIYGFFINLNGQILVQNLVNNVRFTSISNIYSFCSGGSWSNNHLIVFCSTHDSQTSDELMFFKQSFGTSSNGGGDIYLSDYISTQYNYYSSVEVLSGFLYFINPKYELLEQYTVDNLYQNWVYSIDNDEHFGDAMVITEQYIAVLASDVDSNLFVKKSPTIYLKKKNQQFEHFPFVWEESNFWQNIWKNFVSLFLIIFVICGLSICFCCFKRVFYRNHRSYDLHQSFHSNSKYPNYSNLYPNIHTNTNLYSSNYNWKNGNRSYFDNQPNNTAGYFFINDNDDYGFDNYDSHVYEREQYVEYDGYPRISGVSLL
eukprot:TRINITY_DN14082_c0_g1_i1.p1 TRINITY_DN14082_c0_g1~~TRINITY_DN14082_c0_g1_i1.p1  ORF type:complete len:525 (+),score=96.95 TRINITY_DN14082_c0_g1_i1:44-1618(+)